MLNCKLITLKNNDSYLELISSHVSEMTQEMWNHLHTCRLAGQCHLLHPVCTLRAFAGSSPGPKKEHQESLCPWPQSTREGLARSWRWSASLLLSAVYSSITVLVDEVSCHDVQGRTPLSSRDTDKDSTPLIAHKCKPQGGSLGNDRECNETEMTMKD